MEVQITETRSGARTLVVDGKYFHSAVDPVKEASRQAAELKDSSTVVLLSPGLGFLARQLSSQVLLIEKHQAIAALSPDLEFLINPTELKIKEKIFGYSDLGKVSIIMGTMLEADQDYYIMIREAVVHAVEKRAEEIITHRAFGEIWKANLESNAPRFSQAKWYTALREHFVRRRVIILSAGPTLEEDLLVLREMGAGSYIVFATDSALPMALCAGIVPNFCITVDPQPIKAPCLRNLGRIPLIASVLSPPGSLSSADSLYFFGQGHPLEERYGVPVSEVIRDVGGSVATAAATIAVRLGAKDVVLVGQDLAYVEGRTHTRGTVRENASTLSRFRAFEAAGHVTSRSALSVTGGKVETTPALDSYRRYFERLAAENKRVRFIQTSSKGAKIDIERMNIKDYLQENTQECR